MNSKSVLSRIVKMLTLSDENPIQAKTKDGLILQSSNFDVNDDIVEVGADGKTTPLADGEYTISFTTADGQSSTQVIDVDGGKISAIQGTDEAADTSSDAAEETTEKMEDDAATSVVPITMADATTDTAHALPNTTDEDPRNKVGPDTDDNKDPIISLTNRLTALEAAHADMIEKMGKIMGMDATNPMMTPDMGVEPLTPTNMAEVDEEELPKLDGAPIEPQVKFSALENQKNYGKKEENAQASFLSKLYK